MVNIIDKDYLASSSAHLFKVNKPNRRKSLKKTEPEELKAYDLLMDKFNNDMEKNEKKLFSTLGKDLAQYVEQVSKIYTSGTKTSFRHTRCAIVTMSINMNSLSSLYDLLFENIEKFTSMRIVINSNRVKCVSDFVKLLQENMAHFDRTAMAENIPLNFYSLTADFYNNNNSNKLPLVVVFEDFDCFSVNFLNDLLILIHENLEKMPLVLICVQSTDILPLNMRLPSKATKGLLVNHFSFNKMESCFENLIEEICWDPYSPFKLGPKTIDHLISVYKLWDTSLTGAFRRVKLSIFEHFFDNKCAKLCCPVSELDDAIKSLTDDELISIRQLPSLQGLELPKDDKDFRKALKIKCQEICDYTIGIQDELKMYHRLKECILVGETHTFLMSTWLTFLDSDKFSGSDDVYFLGERFLELEKHQIIALMAKLSKFPESTSSDIFKALNAHFKDFSFKIKEEPLAYEFMENKPHDPQMRTRASHGIHSPRKSGGLNRMAYLNSLQNAVKKVPKIRKWQTQFLEILKEEVDKIRNPLHLPCHEVFFFDDFDRVKQFSLSESREALLRVIAKPQEILNCSCCKGIGPSSPDITVTYAIYCDNLRIANLAKCFDIFKELIAQPVTTRVSPRKKPRKEYKKVDEKEALSRFIQTIGNLEYVGLLRAHPRKTDHIERQVWPIYDKAEQKDTNSDSDEQMSQISQNFGSFKI